MDQHLTFTARICGVADFQEIGARLLEELEMADRGTRFRENCRAA